MKFKPSRFRLIRCLLLFIAATIITAVIPAQTPRPTRTPRPRPFPPCGRLPCSPVPHPATPKRQKLSLFRHQTRHFNAGTFSKLWDNIWGR